jgi:hypothetical protein
MHPGPQDASEYVHVDLGSSAPSWNEKRVSFRPAARLCRADFFTASRKAILLSRFSLVYFKIRKTREARALAKSNGTRRKIQMTRRQRTLATTPNRAFPPL